jgi:ribose transport system permease protein
MLKSKPRLNLGFDRFSGIYLWVLFIVVFGIWVPSTFLTSGTLHSVASAQSIAGILSLAILIPLACGHFDLSIGATANLAGLTAVMVQIDWHWSVPLSILLAIGVGLAVGCINGFVVVKLGVSSFIATLGMSSILAAFLVIITNNEIPAPPTSTAWASLTQHVVGGFQIVVLYLLVLGVIVWWFLEHTPAGRYIYATGANPDAARLSGVRVDRWAWASLIASGAIAACGGILFTSLTGPSLSFGSSLLLPAFAAAFLGSTQLQPGRFNVWGTLIAIYVLATGVQGLQLVSGQQWLDSMFNGVALILAVALAGSRQRRELRGHRRRKGEGVPVQTEIGSGEGTGPSFIEPRERPSALETNST